MMAVHVSSNADIWQKVIALDSSYLKLRSLATPLTAAQLEFYLQRRCQLSRGEQRLPQSHLGGVSSTNNEADRADYLLIRKTLLANKYAHVGKSTSTAAGNKESASNVEGSSSYNVLLERYQRQHQLSVSQFSASLSSSTHQLNAEEVTVRPTEEHEAPVSKGYAFAGIETIFDHHKDSITRIRFANNDSHQLAITSSDGSASICHIGSSTTGHRINYLRSPSGGGGGGVRCEDTNPIPVAIMDVAWSSANDCLATVSLDGSVCLWTLDGGGGSPALTRRLRQVEASPLLVCEFHPINNNYLVVGGISGVVQVLNLSTGRALKHGKDQLHHPPPMRIKLPPCRSREDLSHHLGRGCITAVTFDPQLPRLWVGTDQGLIQTYSCCPSAGRLSRTSRHNLAKGGLRFLPSVTSISYHAWLSHEDSSGYCLVNSAGLGLLLFTVEPNNGELQLKSSFSDLVVHAPICSPPTNNYGLHLLHSCFAPLISFRPGGSACGVTASEEGGKVLVVDVTRGGSVVTCLQGHDCGGGERSVIDVALSWDESVLASADETGVVILWKRT